MKIQHRKIVELSSAEARKYFLKSEVYFNLDLPKYFNFAEMLETINNYFDTNSIISNQGYDFKADLEKISTKITGNNKYNIFIHKNQNNYRPISFINPVLYVFLAPIITQEKNWQIIQERFKKLKQDSKIKLP